MAKEIVRVPLLWRKRHKKFYRVFLASSPAKGETPCEELSVEADPIYQTILIAAEKAFWRAVKAGETPLLFDCEPPKPRIEAVRVVDMNVSNSWAEFSGLFRETREAHTNHERAKSELKGLMPEDSQWALQGHPGREGVLDPFGVIRCQPVLGLLGRSHERNLRGNHRLWCSPESAMD